MKIANIVIIMIALLMSQAVCHALEDVMTVPAEDPQGVMLTLPAGTYAAQIESGAVALHFPIHPDYCWRYSMLIGTGVKGGQAEANIGSLYVDPNPKVFTQAEAEKAALKALKENIKGTYVVFELKKEETVRFWVSDYDYSDNSGSERVRIYSVDKKEIQQKGKP